MTIVRMLYLFGIGFIAEERPNSQRKIKSKSPGHDFNSKDIRSLKKQERSRQG